MSKIFFSTSVIVFCLLGLKVVPVMADATSTIATTSTSTGITTVATTTASSTLEKQDRVTVEKRVREYFYDIPVMIDIARCESNFRQFTDGGSVFKGGSAGAMIGVYQFFESIHSAPALKLGFDINTLEGNIGYARELYKSSGSTPWGACVPISTTTIMDANTQLRIELMTKLIGLLKQLLALELAKR